MYTQVFQDGMYAPYSFSQNGGSVKGLYNALRSGVRTGTRVENWRKLVSDHGNASSAFSTTRYKVLDAVPAQGSFSAVWPTDPNTKLDKAFTGYHQSLAAFKQLASPPESAALAKLYQRLRDNRSEMNGLQFFGELRETIRMLKRPAAGLRDGMSRWVNDVGRNFRRHPDLLLARNRRNAQRIASDLWLEGCFGWAPFVSDIKSIATTAARIATDNGVRYTRVQSRSQVSGSEPMSFSVYKADGLASLDANPTVSNRDCGALFTSVAEVQWIAFLTSTLSAPTNNFQRVAELSGLTWENVVPTAYELVPWSFLADYMSNLGQCVNAVCTDTTGVRFAVKTIRQRDTTDVRSAVNLASLAASVASYGWSVRKIAGTAGRFCVTRTSIQRSVVDRLPTPRLEFTLTNDGLKWANVTALLNAQSKSFRLG